MKIGCRETADFFCFIPICFSPPLWSVSQKKSLSLQHETEDTNKLEAIFAVLCCDIWNISSDSIVLDDAWNNTVVVCR